MKQMCVADWIKTSKHFINLKNLNVKTYEMIVAAMKSFSIRICPRMLFSSLFLINDSLKSIVKWIYDASQLVKMLINRQHHAIPCQIDLCIAVGKPLNTTEKKNDNENFHEYESDDSDNEDDDDDEKKINEKEVGFIDIVGDIRDKLEK
eukprot:302952_1